MGYQVVWPAVSVADKRDPKNVKDGIVFPRGAVLPDWVDDFTIHVLTTTGGVKAVETPDKALQLADNPPAPVRLQEHPPVPQVDLTGTSQDPAVKSDPKAAKAKNDDPNRPADSASKAEWLEYARKRETDKAKRDALTDDVTRAELINTYG
jgi:hypothetical protein